MLCWHGISYGPVSVTSHQSSTETAHWSELSWAQKLPVTYPTLCYEEIWESLKIMILPSGTLSQTLVLMVLAEFCRYKQQTTQLFQDFLRPVGSSDID